MTADEGERTQDLREAWRNVPTTGLADVMLVWLARRELEASGLGLIPDHTEQPGGVGFRRDLSRVERREGILVRHRGEVNALMVRGRSTCGAVHDRCVEQRRPAIAHEVELWAVAQLRPHHVPVDASEQAPLFDWPKGRR